MQHYLPLSRDNTSRAEALHISYTSHRRAESGNFGMFPLVSRFCVVALGTSIRTMFRVGLGDYKNLSLIHI